MYKERGLGLGRLVGILAFLVLCVAKTAVAVFVRMKLLKIKDIQDDWLR